MAQKVILKNLRRAPFHATEYHKIVCRRRQACRCAISHRTSPAGKRVAERSPASFTILGLSESQMLDPEVLFVPQVVEALRGDSPWLKKRFVDGAELQAEADAKAIAAGEQAGEDLQ